MTYTDYQSYLIEANGSMEERLTQIPSAITLAPVRVSIRAGTDLTLSASLLRTLADTLDPPPPPHAIPAVA